MRIPIPIRIALMMAFVVYVGTGWKCGDKPPASVGEVRKSVDIPFDGTPNVNDHILQTPGGVTLRSVDDVPRTVQLAIDQGIQRAIDDAKGERQGWTRMMTLPEAQIFIVKPDAQTVETDPGAPILNVHYNCAGNPGEYKDCSVTSAGTTIGRSVGGTNLGGYADYLSLVIGSDAGTNWQHARFVREAARNEYEHALECANDQGECIAWATVGDVHPHRGTSMWGDPLPGEARTLRSVKPMKLPAVVR